MNITETDLVRPCDARPASNPYECFYCHKPIGSAHRSECVASTRTVVVRLTYEVVVEKPRCWDADAIEFHMNESSRCANNCVSDLASWIESNDERCVCGVASAEFVREATEKDCEDLPYLAKGEA